MPRISEPRPHPRFVRFDGLDRLDPVTSGASGLTAAGTPEVTLGERIGA